MFRLGQCYSRRQINEAVGGSIQSYLPTVGNEVVAGCFTTKLNPEAPNRIFVGSGPIIRGNAHIAAYQPKPFPVFLKRGNKRFEFIGHFRGAGIDQSATALAEANRKSARADVSAILILLKAG